MNGPGGHRTPIAGAGAGRAQDHYYRRRVFCAASDVPAPAWNSAGSARTLCGEEAMYGNGKVAEPGVVITLPLHDAMSMRAIGRVELLEKTTLAAESSPSIGRARIRALLRRRASNMPGHRPPVGDRPADSATGRGELPVRRCKARFHILQPPLA